MTYFEDLSRYTYGDVTGSAAPARNVGWLDASHHFSAAPPRPELLEALWEYCKILVVPTRGLHSCELCALPPSTFVERGTRLLLGSGEIRVFGLDGEVFAAPNLVYHYIRDHQYHPPEGFIRAVEDGPRPGSDEYSSLLNHLGLSWMENTPVDEEPRQFRFVRTENGVERQETKHRG